MMAHESLTEMNYGLDHIGRGTYYGIYEGIVKSVSDPLKRGRILVSVNQITGAEVSHWAPGCFPISNCSYHPDHKPHTADQIASLLQIAQFTVNSTGTGTGSSATGGAVTTTDTVTATVGPLMVVPRVPNAPSATNQLNHPHVSAVKSMTSKIKNLASVITSPSTTAETDTSKYSHGQTAPDGTSTPEHTFHRALPIVGQQVWVMFIAGNPEYPVWVGVQ